MRRRCCGTHRFRDWLFRTVVDTQNDYQLDDEKDKTRQYQISHLATVTSGAIESLKAERSDEPGQKDRG